MITPSSSTAACSSYFLHISARVLKPHLAYAVCMYAQTPTLEQPQCRTRALTETSTEKGPMDHARPSRSPIHYCCYLFTITVTIYIYYIITLKQPR